MPLTEKQAGACQGARKESLDALQILFLMAGRALIAPAFLSRRVWHYFLVEQSPIRRPKLQQSNAVKLGQSERAESNQLQLRPNKNYRGMRLLEN